jgi:2'-5' RNA ligase
MSDIKTLEGKKPLVATFAIDQSAQNYFNQLRQQHFPAELNYLDAHLTLFHALPDEDWIIAGLESYSKRQRPFQATALGILSLGGGTAFKIVSPELSSLHLKLQKSWFTFLSNQDRQKRNFHVTIQNKVDSKIAKNLQLNMAQEFIPFDFTVNGIILWRYHAGPWEYVIKFDFFKEEAR